MAAVDDLTELVERAAAAERAALASKWKDRSDVESVSRRVRRAIIDQTDELRRAPGTRAELMSDRWREVRTAALDRPDPPDTRRPAGRPPSPTSTRPAPRPTPSPPSPWPGWR